MILSIHQFYGCAIGLGLLDVAVYVVCLLFTDVGPLIHTDHDVVLFLGIGCPRVKGAALDKTMFYK